MSLKAILLRLRVRYERSEISLTLRGKTLHQAHAVSFLVKMNRN